MDSIVVIYLICFLVGGIFVVFAIVIGLQIGKKKKVENDEKFIYKAKEIFDAFSIGKLPIYNDIFFRIMNLLTTKENMMNPDGDNYEGLYAIYNVRSKICYIDYSENVFASIGLHLTGKGNQEIYKDLMRAIGYMNPSQILIKALMFERVSEQELKTEEDKFKQYFSSNDYKYYKNSPDLIQKTPSDYSGNKNQVKGSRVSVTKMISMIQQPRGGYLNISDFELIHLSSRKTLHEVETVSPGLVGLTVDYMTRFLLGCSAEEAFNISLKGAAILEDDRAREYLNCIQGNDEESILNAIKLVAYDCVFRAGPQTFVDKCDIEVDSNTISNISEMIDRSLHFFEKYGPVRVFSPTFEGGYTDNIASGDGDFLTEDTLWDFKVSKNKPNNKNTLQILIYYLMGKHSIHDEYDDIKYLGLFNPRLNIVYRIEISKISKETIEDVEKEIIGY